MTMITVTEKKKTLQKRCWELICKVSRESMKKCDIVENRIQEWMIQMAIKG